MSAECIVCQGDFCEPGFNACVHCMTEHGTTDPFELETIAMSLASRRRNARERALRTTGADLISALTKLQAAE